MGVILACISIGADTYQKRRDEKKRQLGTVTVVGSPGSQTHSPSQSRRLSPSAGAGASGSPPPPPYEALPPSAVPYDDDTTGSSRAGRGTAPAPTRAGVGGTGREASLPGPTAGQGQGHNTARATGTGAILRSARAIRTGSGRGTGAGGSIGGIAPRFGTRVGRKAERGSLSHSTTSTVSNSNSKLPKQESTAGPAASDPITTTRAGEQAITRASAVYTRADQKEEEKQKKKGGKMATDEDYMAFLDKANQDPMEGRRSNATSTTQNKSEAEVELKTMDEGVSVPKVLQTATKEAYYISEADEPFVPVCLKFTGRGLPDEASFAKLVHHPKPQNADVQIMDIGEWDPQGQYKELVEATREVTKGSDVRVYRIASAKGGARVEYWLVGVEGGRLIGVKALAVES